MRQLLERVLEACSREDDAYHIPSLLYGDILKELEKPEPKPKPEPVCFAKWEPIETAPKDGTEILLFALFDIGLCYWSDKMDSWTWGAGNRFNLPSHWMPLPEIPSKCTHPPAQQKPLSDDEVRIIINSTFRTDTGWIEDFMILVRSVEQAHGIK